MNISIINQAKAPKNIVFKNNTVTSPQSQANVSMPAPPEVSKNASIAYASPQIVDTSYKVKETFSLPFLKDQKMYQLSNGHKIVLIKRPGLTAIQTTIDVGENNDNNTQRGTAHLLEHLHGDTFLYPKTEEDKKIKDKLGSFFNAETEDTTTSYYMKGYVQNKEDLNDMLKMQAKILQNKVITDKDLENEKKIINNEMGNKSPRVNNFYFRKMETIKTLFNQTDMYNYTTTPETLKNMTTSSVENYDKKYYNPKNMITTIVGNIDDNTINLVAKNFAPQKEQQFSNDKSFFKDIDTTNPIQKTVRKDIEGFDSAKDAETSYTLGFVGPAKDNQQDTLNLNILKFAINKKIYNKSLNIPHSDSAETVDVSNTMQKPIAFVIEGSNTPEKAEKSINDLYKLITGIKTQPISYSDLDKIKQEIITVKAEPIEDHLELADLINKRTFINGSPDEKTIEALDKITPTTLQETAMKYLNLDKASLVVIHPKETVENSKLSTEKVGANKISFTGNNNSLNDLHMEDVHEYRLPNNLKVVIDARENNLKSAVTFELKSQKTLTSNPMAFLLGNLFGESDKTKEQLKKDNIDLSLDNTSLSSTAYATGNGDKTLEMIGYTSGILLKPEPIKKEKLNEIKKYFCMPEESHNRLDDRINAEINKENKNYSLDPSIGLDMEYEDFEKAHKELLNNAQGTIFITMPKEEFKKNKDTILQTLQKVPNLKQNNYAKFFNKYRPQPLKQNTVFVNEDMNSKTAKISKRFKIVESGNIKDRATIILINQILGGSDSSILFKNLREKDKIAYSANSILASDHETGDYSILKLSTELSNKNKNDVKTAIDEFNSGINELINNKVDEETLNKAKIEIKTSILSRLESTDSSNRFLAANDSSFYGKNYQQELVNALDNITPEYIQQLAKYYLTQPSITGLSADKASIEANKQFLLTQGDVITVK